MVCQEDTREIQVMPQFSADLKLEGFEELSKGLNPTRFMAALRSTMRKHNKKSALLLKARLVKELTNSKRRGYAANAYATTVFKSGKRKRSSPLLDTGVLRSNCGFKMDGPFGFVVGTTRKSRKGVDLAAVLHEGARIAVTEKMRRVWFAMAIETGGRVKPLKTSTTHIIIPPRPFLKNALIEDKSVGLLVVNGWKQAALEAHKRLGGKLK